MKKLIFVSLLLAATSAFADPGNGNAFGLGNGGNANASAGALSVSDADASARSNSNASNFTSVSSLDVQSQSQHQTQSATGGNATSYGSSAYSGPSTSSALAGGGVAYATMGNVTSSSAPSTSNSTVGNVSATSAPSTSSVGNVSTGAATATVGAVVEQGAVQSSTNVTTNYKEAAQGVALVLTTACGTAASGSGRSFTFGAAQGQDAFCKDLALAKVYFDLGQNEKGMQFIEAAAKLVKVDNFFDQITTVLTLGILK